jgi:hypothetical protein
MQPTLGRIVYYTLSAEDADRINRLRTDGSIATRLHRAMQNFTPPHWPYGAQAHLGLIVQAGDVLPGMVVHVDNVTQWLELQVYLRGNDVLFVTDVKEGPDSKGNILGCWQWPPRMPT